MQGCLINLAFLEYLRGPVWSGFEKCPHPIERADFKEGRPCCPQQPSACWAQELESSKESYLQYVPMGVGETPSIHLCARAALFFKVS